MNLYGKKTVVAGAGVSGIGAVRLLKDTGAVITLYDGNEKADRDTIMKKIPEGAEVELITGKLPEGLAENTDLLVVSPGIPSDSPLVNEFRKSGAEVWGEIELAYNYEKGTVYAITGTNGKTTTTSLLGEIMRAYNPKTYVVGNIGKSYTGEVLKTESDSITVAEISSFQLETVKNFAPRGTAILNITPDHLDRHYTMENYAAVKESITKNQWQIREDDFCVLNYDDEELRSFGKKIKNPVFFSTVIKPERGAYLDGNVIKYVKDGWETEIVSVGEMKIFGKHNYENAMAAAALAMEAGVPVNIISNVIKNFAGVEHRIEYVRTLEGVKYYNDSKGTNPDSSVKALEAMTGKVILIAGGYDKHVEFDEFVRAFDNKVKLLVLIGQTADIIAETARKYGFNNIVSAESLSEAVVICRDNAADGDTVLLSPACASWGMFSNYEERGVLFKKYVNELI